MGFGGLICIAGGFERVQKTEIAMKIQIRSLAGGEEGGIVLEDATERIGQKQKLTKR